MAALRQLGVHRAVSAGEYLYREGDAGYDFYVVVAGAIEIIANCGSSTSPARDLPVVIVTGKVLRHPTPHVLADYLGLTVGKMPDGASLSSPCAAACTTPRPSWRPDRAQAYLQ